MKESAGLKDLKINKESQQQQQQLASNASDSKAAAATASSATTDEADKHKRFENEGVVFKAKLIGSELVMEPRGDKMCQNSIQRLKAIIKGTNSHKKRIVLKISYDGVKVYDEKTNEMLHHHEVSQISYIASDDTDNRTFGYVSDVPNKAHQFICFKTGGPAINVMSVISALFEAVLEKKNQAEKEKEKQQQQFASGGKQSESHTQDSIDLIGDSGIMDIGDVSIVSSDDKQQQQQQQSNQQSHHHHHHSIQHQPHHQQLPYAQSQASSIFDSHNLASPGNSFGTNSAAASNSGNNNINNTNNKQSASTDLIFNDLFAGLSDPIIVDKNDSLISYKLDNTAPAQIGSSSGGGGGSSSNILAQRRINAPRPIPPRQNSSSHHPGLLPPPSSLPRPAPMMMSSGPSHNRSLVYNHSSVSLSDAAITSHSTFSASANQTDNYVDRYAVFNDIDNLPSIFESASLGNVNKASTGGGGVGAGGGGGGGGNGSNSMFRQTNPFDDDFFA